MTRETIFWTVWATLMLVDWCAWFASGRQRYLNARYVCPLIGGWMALHDKLNDR